MAFIYFTKYFVQAYQCRSSSLSLISFSTIQLPVVNCSLKILSVKIPEIKNSDVLKLCTIVSSVIKSCTTAQNASPLCARRVHTVHPTSLRITQQPPRLSDPLLHMHSTCVQGTLSSLSDSEKRGWQLKYAEVKLKSASSK